MKNSLYSSLSEQTRRRISIIGWMLLALAYLVFFLIDLRFDFVQLQLPCTGALCNYLAISQVEIDVLESWGLSSITYSMIMNGATLLAVSACWLLAGLILWRQGSSRIGWFVSLALIVMPIAMISDADNLAFNYPGYFIPSVILSVLGAFILFLFLYLFPNGRFYPRWAFIPFIITFLVFTTYSLEFNALITLPVWFTQIANLSLNFLFFLAGGVQILRYRKESTSLERQQTKWMLLGIIILVLSFPVWFLFFNGGMRIPPGSPRLLASIIGWFSIMFALSALPVTMAIAIMRYKLWDIDILIRRTLQYALLTGLLAVVYFGLVISFQGVFSTISNQQSEIFIVLSTLAIAALFNPLRRRVQGFIDRRFYRKKYDAEQALARFASVARDEVELDKLTAALIEVVEETVQPEKVSLWLVQETKREKRA